MNEPKQHSPGRPADDASTPGRPHDTSRQQKHKDQNLDSGSRSLDEQSSGDRAHHPPKPPGAK
jgi:hypothetical protein